MLPTGQVQAQRPVGLHAVEVDHLALPQHRQVAGLAHVLDELAQDRAAQRGDGVVGEDGEAQPLQAGTDGIGAPGGLALHVPGLLEEGQRAVQGGLGQPRGLHELGERGRARRAHQGLEHRQGLERGGVFLRPFARGPVGAFFEDGSHAGRLRQSFRRCNHIVPPTGNSACQGRIHGILFSLSSPFIPLGKTSQEEHP